MVRFLSIAIECFSSIIFVIPAMVVVQYVIFQQHNIKKFLMVLIFAFYSIAVFSVVGIPTAYTLKVDFGINLIPLIDIFNSPVEYIKNTILNIILFMPMGFLLPVIWEKYHSIRKTIFMGLTLSLFIELLQIFTFRLTDIDDLITNTLGTILGYYCGNIVSFKLPLDLSINTKNISAKYEPVIILAAVFLIAFFLEPFVSNEIWDIVLSSSLWERIK